MATTSLGLRALAHQHACLRRRQVVRRRVLGRDRAVAAGIAPVGPPREHSQAEGQERQAERPVVLEEPDSGSPGGRSPHHARRPRDGNRQALPRAQRPRRAEGEDIAVALLDVVRARDAARPRIGDGQGIAGDRSRRADDHRLGLADGHVPLVAGDVPVQLLVIVDAEEPAPHAIDHGHRLGRIDRARDRGLDPHVAPGVGHGRLEGPELLVEHLDAVEPQRELEPPARIPHRDEAIHRRMAAAKIEGDRLPDVEARIGMNRDADGEAIDGECAPLPLRRRRPGHDGEDDRGNAQKPTPGDRRGGRARRIRAWDGLSLLLPAAMIADPARRP